MKLRAHRPLPLIMSDLPVFSEWRAESAVNMIFQKKYTKIIFVFLLLVQQSLASAGTPGEVLVGQKLGEAELRGIATKNESLSSFRGKPLFINVWASWCGPCRAEMASIEKLAKGKDGDGFNVIGISTDDDFAAAASFVKQSRLSFRNYIDRNLLLENMLGANRLPLTILVDADGKIIKKIAGSRDWDAPEARNLINQAFRLKTN